MRETQLVHDLLERVDLAVVGPAVPYVERDRRLVLAVGLAAAGDDGCLRRGLGVARARGGGDDFGGSDDDLGGGDDDF